MRRAGVQQSSPLPDLGQCLFPGILRQTTLVWGLGNLVIFKTALSGTSQMIHQELLAKLFLLKFRYVCQEIRLFLSVEKLSRFLTSIRLRMKAYCLAELWRGPGIWLLFEGGRQRAWLSLSIGWWSLSRHPRADVTQADGVASAPLCCMALGTVRGRQATQFQKTLQSRERTCREFFFVWGVPHSFILN